VVFMFNLKDGITEDSPEANGWYIEQALEVATDHNFVHVWTCEKYGTLEVKRLRIYKLRTDNNVTDIVKTVNINASNGEVDCFTNTMEFDGLDTILTSCYDSTKVYFFNATSGAYLRTVDIRVRHL
jgi:hypothetical protein